MSAALTRAPAPPPVEAEEFDTSTPVEALVTPVTLADIACLSSWLLARLRQFWPEQFTERTIANRAAMWVNSNQYCFLKTDKAVGLATLVHDPLDAVPAVQEVFLLLREGAKPRDGAAVYRALARWGKPLGAREVRLGYCSDLTHGQIKECLKGAQARAELYWDIE